MLYHCSMKIAVISDIHGNKLALDNVLDDIKQRGANKIFCLGDIAMGGYDPCYTIDKLFELKKELKDDFKIIQGNTDKLIVDFSENLFNEMNVNEKKLLNNLEKEEIVDIKGIKIHLVHGSPRRQDENIFPDMEIEKVEEMVEKSPAEIILCGHTHIPCGYSLNSGKTVVNAGSVGRSMTKDKMPVYLLITIDSNGQYLFEHIKVKYDNKYVSELIKKRDFIKSEEFSKLYL